MLVVVQSCFGVASCSAVALVKSDVVSADCCVHCSGQKHCPFQKHLVQKASLRLLEGVDVSDHVVGLSPDS